MICRTRRFRDSVRATPLVAPSSITHRKLSRYSSQSKTLSIYPREVSHHGSSNGEPMEVVMNRIAILAVIAVLMFGGSATAHPDSTNRISMVPGQIDLEVTGQVDNSGTPAPLGSSTQF